MKLIETKTLGAAAASIEFTSIPQVYTDLVITVSSRSSVALSSGTLSFNGSTANFTRRSLRGNGASASSTTTAADFFSSESGFTANTFGNNVIYISNYTGSNNKLYSTDGANENNATTANTLIVAGLWSQTAAITSVGLIQDSGNFVAGSTFSIYGITKGSDGITTAS